PSETARLITPHCDKNAMVRVLLDDGETLIGGHVVSVSQRSSLQTSLAALTMLGGGPLPVHQQTGDTNVPSETARLITPHCLVKIQTQNLDPQDVTKPSLLTGRTGTAYLPTAHQTLGQWISRRIRVAAQDYLHHR
ncbi:MAG: hypothetical protein AAFP69_21710, partial [Planctomycetota bacterium]